MTTVGWHRFPLREDWVEVRYGDGTIIGPIEAWKIDWDNPSIVEYRIVSERE